MQTIKNANFEKENVNAEECEFLENSENANLEKKLTNSEI